MKIAYWTVYPNTHQRAFIDGLRACGADVVVCYFSHHDAYRKKIGWKEPELLPWERQFATPKEAMRDIPDFSERVQIVPSFFNLTSWRLIALCWRKKIPWAALTERSRGRWFMRPLQWLLAQTVARNGLGIFGIGKNAVLQYTRLGVPEAKCKWISYTTPERKAARGDGNPESKIINHKPEKVVFVYSGSFAERKATDVLGAAWKRLYERFGDKVSLMAIGAGPMKNCLDTGGVEFLGTVAQDKVMAIMASGDVVVLPSRFDGWGMALMEGAACSLAMIGSDRTESSELIDAESGIVVKAGDAGSLYEAMAVYAADPELARRHGRHALERVSKTFAVPIAQLFLSSISEWMS